MNISPARLPSPTSSPTRLVLEAKGVILSITMPNLAVAQEIAHRPILWNIDGPANIFLMYLMAALSLVVCASGLLARFELWRSGRQSSDSDNGALLARIKAAIDGVLLQGRTVRHRPVALAHTLIFIGFLTLLFTTTMVAIDHDFGIPIYRGDFYLLLTVGSDLLGAALIVGCALMAHRRYIERAELVHNRLADGAFLGFLVLLCLQGFLLEGLRIHATQDPWASYSPVGWLFSKFFWALSLESTTSLHFLAWWFHTLTVFVGIALIPYSKFFHVIAAALNLTYEPRSRPKGALPSPGDIEQIVERGEEVTFGLGSIKDYTWKQLLDLDACTSCGRCQDACPAYLSGKPLSPKWMILDSRNHMLALQSGNKMPPASESYAAQRPGIFARLDRLLLRNFLFGSGLEERGDGFVYASSGAFRARNALVQSSALKLGSAATDRIAKSVMDPEVFWSCTTCMACVEACPVGINHVDHIVENRRNMVLMEGEIPLEAQATLRALENRRNPFGAPEDRTKWMHGLPLRILKPGDSVDYLYWVGCVSAFDSRKQKIARALTTLMHHAGLDFAILGNAEGCSGDPARRLGEESLFQSLAKYNIGLLRSISFKVLVANCPHCFNTIKNEYPQIGNLGEGKSPEIIHHSVLLQRLLSDGKLIMGEGAENFTFHDPCYLGRYNDEYEAPREALRGVKGLKIVEMERSREKSMCCGAGGGHFWMDRKVGERVNVLRTDQAAATEAQNVATGCPFCLQMLEDGVKLTGRENGMQVRDIAEVLADRLAKAVPA